MRTIIKESRVKPKEPTIVEGLPGLGSVGKIVALYLIRQLEAKKIATLYSPHFPYYALVDRYGVARLPKNDFYLFKDTNLELVIITGDCQPQTTYGQYEVANEIVSYAKKCSAKLIITVGGYSSEEKTAPKIVGAASRTELVERLTSFDVLVDKTGLPIVGVAGLILALAKPRGVDAMCLLGETIGYVPDPRAAKSVLEVLSKLLNIMISMDKIDKQIERMKRIEEKIREADQGIEAAIRERRAEERVTYIS